MVLVVRGGGVSVVSSNHQNQLQKGRERQEGGERGEREGRELDGGEVWIPSFDGEDGKGRTKHCRLLCTTMMICRGNFLGNKV